MGIILETLKLLMHLQKIEEKKQRAEQREQRRLERQAYERRMTEMQEELLRQQSQHAIFINPSDVGKKVEIKYDEIDKLIEEGLNKHLSKKQMILSIWSESELTQSEIEKYLDSKNILWDQHAIKSAHNLVSEHGYERKDLFNRLIDIDQFEPKDAIKAVNTIDWDNKLIKDINKYELFTFKSRQAFIDYVLDDLGYTSSSPRYELAVQTISKCWESEILRVSKEIMLENGYGKPRIKEELKESDLTVEDIQFVINNLEDMWLKSAVNAINTMLEEDVLSKKEIFDYLIEDFDESELNDAFNYLNIDFNEQALKYSIIMCEDKTMGPKYIYDSLLDECGFSKEEAEYAMNHLTMDWKQRAMDYSKEIVTDYLADETKEELWDDISFELEESFETDAIEYVKKHFDEIWQIHQQLQ